MARNSIIVDASPATVFGLLADGRSYAEWVVGAKRIRSVDPDWPRPGSRFHHTVGVWPLHLNDSTEVVEAVAPSYMVLKARARPAGVARVVFTLSPEDGGTLVTMEEEATAGPGAYVPRRLLDLGVLPRNAKTLRRLKDIVEERTSARGS